MLMKLRKTLSILICGGIILFTGCTPGSQTGTTEVTTTTAESTTTSTTENTTTAATTETTTTAATTGASTEEQITTAQTTSAQTDTEKTTAATTSEKVTTKKTTTEKTTAKTTEKTTATTEKPTEKLIALTFDDGPNTTTTVEVLDLLEKYDIVGSFFLVGNNINDETAPVVKRAYDMGCEINNHSRTHSYMDKMSVDDIKAEIEYTNEKVKAITGEYPHFFRPPYIAVSMDMFSNIDLPFICGKGCNDWNEKIDAQRRITSILRQAEDGVIILLHDAEGNSQTVEALDTIIPSLLDEGYRFVTVSELFEEAGITPVSEIIYSKSSQTTMY